MGTVHMFAFYITTLRCGGCVDAIARFTLCSASVLFDVAVGKVYLAAN